MLWIIVKEWKKMNTKIDWRASRLEAGEEDAGKDRGNIRKWAGGYTWECDPRGAGEGYPRSAGEGYPISAGEGDPRGVGQFDIGDSGECDL